MILVSRMLRFNPAFFIPLSPLSSSSLVPFSSVPQLCMTLCDPMEYSMPGLPVPHHLPYITQVRVNSIGNPIQPSHPLTPSSPSAFSLSSIWDFSNESSVLVRWPKYWSFSFSISSSSEYTVLISLKTDWFDLLAVQGTFRSLLMQIQIATGGLRRECWLKTSLAGS